MDLHQQQRNLDTQCSDLKARSNAIGKEVGQKIKGGADPKGDEVKALREQGNSVKAQIAEIEPQTKELASQIETLLLAIPNIPAPSTPVGKDDSENVEIRRWGDEYIPDNPKILPHWDIGESLGILNFERSVKIAQSRFVTLMGAGAAL